jgi:hypothetical protein
VNNLDHTSLNRLFANTIARLRLCSETPASQAKILKRSQHNGSSPRGPRQTTADRLAGLWPQLTTDESRRSLLAVAMAELQSATHAAKPPKAYLERDTPAWRQRIAEDTRSLRAVADDYGVSHEQVRKLRHQFSEAV